MNGLRKNIMRIGGLGTNPVCHKTGHRLILSNYCIEIPLGCEGQFTVVIGLGEEMVDDKGFPRRNRDA
jgi:hypothetical protein